METILLDTTPVHDGCWLTRINAAYLERLAPQLERESSTSVVLVEEAEYDEKGQALILRGAPICPITLGFSDTAIVITRQSRKTVDNRPPSRTVAADGDQAFLSETKWLPAWAQEAATQMLEAVREIDDGRLKRGERNKFINRPNNFWTVTAQPRAKGFAVTIYGRARLFKSDRIQVLEDRPGHSRFVIRSLDEVPDAIRLIKQAKEMKD